MMGVLTGARRGGLTVRGARSFRGLDWVSGLGTGGVWVPVKTFGARLRAAWSFIAVGSLLRARCPTLAAPRQIYASWAFISPFPVRWLHVLSPQAVSLISKALLRILDLCRSQSYSSPRYPVSAGISESTPGSTCAVPQAIALAFPCDTGSVVTTLTWLVFFTFTTYARCWCWTQRGRIICRRGRRGSGLFFIGTRIRFIAGLRRRAVSAVIATVCPACWWGLSLFTAGFLPSLAAWTMKSTASINKASSWVTIVTPWRCLYHLAVFPLFLCQLMLAFL